MKLSKDDFNQLLTTILDSYPDITDLEILIRTKLEENLNSIAGGNNNTQTVFKLIEWAESTGQLNQLIKALAEDRPQQQFFQDINNKLKSSIFNTVEMSRNSSQLIITTEEWNKLSFILQQINNNQLINQICRQTLKNKHNDLLGNYLILSKTIDLTNLKDILLNKFPKRKDDIPTIVEFTERLSYEVDPNLANQLNLWTKQIAEKLNISLPTYSKLPLNNETYQYFLLITAIPKGKNQFDLESDLLLYDSSTNNYQPIPKFIDCEERILVQCDLIAIKDKIFELIEICRDYIEYGHILYIQLFLTYPYLGYAFDIEEIIIDQARNDLSCLGNEHPLLVSSYDRFSEKKHYNQFLLRWRERVQNNLTPDLTNLITTIQNLENYNHQNLNQLANQWLIEKTIGLKIMGCWCDEENIQEDLFYYIVKSGIPLVLWIRRNDLPNCKNQLNDLLTRKTFNHWHDLFKQVWECRQKAQAYEHPKIGYHLGILADDPQRIPSHFQHLVPTGK